MNSKENIIGDNYLQYTYDEAGKYHVFNYGMAIGFPVNEQRYAFSMMFQVIFPPIKL